MSHFKFASGCIVGAVAGYAAGVLLAPRSGAESRAMASDVVNDAWDSAIDSYERGQQVVASKIDSMRPNVDSTTDELRAKVDLARERMDQLRDSLNDVAAEEDAAEPAAEAAEELEVEAEAPIIEFNNEPAEVAEAAEPVEGETAE